MPYIRLAGSLNAVSGISNSASRCTVRIDPAFRMTIGDVLLDGAGVSLCSVSAQSYVLLRSDSASGMSYLVYVW